VEAVDNRRHKVARAFRDVTTTPVPDDKLLRGDPSGKKQQQPPRGEPMQAVFAVKLPPDLLCSADQPRSPKESDQPPSPAAHGAHIAEPASHPFSLEVSAVGQ